MPANFATTSVNISLNGTASFVPTALQQRQFFVDRTNPLYLRSSTMTQDGVYLQYANLSLIVPMAQLYAVGTQVIPGLTWPPIILTQPINTTVTHSTSGFFNVSASAEIPITYQWYSSSFSQSLVGGFSQLPNHGDYTGSTTTVLTCSNVDFGMNQSQFFVVASNTSGATTSSLAILTVI